MNFEEYIPTEKQLKFHKAPHKFKLYGGAMGSGKSVALCAEVIRLAITFPGNSVLLARHTLKEAKRTTLRTLFELLPPKIVANYNKTDGIVDLKNGSEILFSDLEHGEKLKSLNLGAFAIDEGTETTDEIFMMLTTRLRKKLPGIKYFGLLASNPEPGWVKDRFITRPSPDYLYVEALTRDNPHLPPEYVKELERDLPPIWKAKYLYGSWDDFGGQIFNPEWIRPSEPGYEIAAKFTAIDPAISEDEEADETAIVTLGVDYEGLIHEIETVHGKWSFNEIVSQVEAVFSRHNPELIGVEVVAFQKALADVLQSQGLPVISMKADRDKIRRAISVSNLFEQGKVRINTHALQRQLIEFPKATHDDLVDACVYALRIIRGHSQEKYEKKEDRYGHLDGRSRNFWEEHFKEVEEMKNGSQKDLLRIFGW